MDCSFVVEGSTKLLVPREAKLSASNPVFYNPAMELARDLSVGLCRVVKPGSFCDLLAGSGARGIRVANEAGVDVTLNDLNPRAVELIRKNAASNGVDVKVESEDARLLLSKSRFDFVDVDPFGPPVAFVDSAMQATRLGGFLGVCATDTSALCGTYPTACRRKYDALSSRTDFYAESGLRILLGFIARTALKYGRGVIPLFSHATLHYFRVYVRVEGRGGVVRDTMEGVSFIQHCPKCLDRRYSSLKELLGECSCAGKYNTYGPLWVGAFAEKPVCDKLKSEMLEGKFNKKKEAVKLIDLVSREQDVRIPYYDLHKVCSKLGKPSPTMEDMQDRLHAMGFRFVRTHFSDVGFRTDGKIKDIIKAISLD